MAELSEVCGPPLPQTIRTLWKMFQDSADSYPNNVALVSAHQPHDLYSISSELLDDDNYSKNPYLRWSFRSLREAVLQFVRGLYAAGVKPGSPIFTFEYNSAQHMIASWASAALGCVLVPINPRNLTNKDEVIHMINTAQSATPGREPVIIAGDIVTAKAVDELGVIASKLKIISSDTTENSTWIPFGHFMQKDLGINGSTDGEADGRVEDGVILFTSGTTSLPKGCFKQHPGFAGVLEGQIEHPSEGWMGPGSKFGVVLPNNHMMGIICSQEAHAVGAAVAYPSPAFQPQAVMELIDKERITHLVLVPTMLHALLSIPKPPGYKGDSLINVAFGGSMCTTDILQRTYSGLGSKCVENAFGMTEGVVVRTRPQRTTSTISDGDEVSAGWSLPGYRIRISDPDSNQVLPRNELGEVCLSSPLITHYLQGFGSDSFYKDEHGREWFKTGDQGRMDEKDRLFITGRYKEMIIRGGENISPAAVETVIAKNPDLLPLNAQIVAAADPIAGEIPVAVVQGTVDAKIRAAIASVILKEMGPLYVPEDIISAQDLGLSDYPRTMAGKVQKTKLTALVKRYLQNRETSQPTVIESQLALEVRDIWARSVGMEPSLLSLDTAIHEIADSITIMRVRDTVRRRTGRTISLQEIVNAGTIAEHVSLLQQGNGPVEMVKNERPVRNGPPGVADMSHLNVDEGLFEPTKNLITQVLSPYGLEWDDVEDVIPAYDFANVMTETKLFDSWGFKLAFLTKSASTTELRQAIEVMLSNNRILASFFVSDPESLGSDDAFHVSIRHTKRFFEVVIHDGGALQTIEEVKAKALDHRESPMPPGPLTRATVYDIKETGTAAVVLAIHHAVLDASTGQIINQDLDDALGAAQGTLALTQHVDYKLWADSYYELRTSSEARAAVRWHVKRLRGLEKHTEALWPPYTMPTEKSTIDDSTEDAVSHSFEAMGLQDLRAEAAHITPVVVLKTALALANIHNTGRTHALFSNLEASRTVFPFLPKAVAALADIDATDVSGPTIQAVINKVEFRPEETVLAMLERMQQDQSDLTRYAAAPLREIISALGSAAAGRLVPEIIGHQSFNWVPGLGTTGTNPHQHFEILSAVVRPYQGLSVNAGLGGPETRTMFLHLRGVGLDKDGQRVLGEKLEKIVLWLLRKENWATRVGDYEVALA
ncbi:hypothetical protein BX600DRAFT_522798 [Xylariales sp. PMI_506]|nr:hypothetical protein BX600DRAFT_522798 [Xylariales sp. PMI_506]